MVSRSSYERIEHFLHELRTQARPDGGALPADPAVAAHVQALLALFHEDLRTLSRSAQLAPPTPRRSKR